MNARQFLYESPIPWLCQGYTVELAQLRTEPGALAKLNEVIAQKQKLCTKIYKHQAVKIPGKPPTVKSDAELQQHLFEIQEKLQRQNLALVLYIKDANGFHEPTEEAIAFCDGGTGDGGVLSTYKHRLINPTKQNQTF